MSLYKKKNTFYIVEPLGWNPDLMYITNLEGKTTVTSAYWLNKAYVPHIQ